MDCRTFESLIGDYLEGGLSAAERSAVATHLGGCVACRVLAESDPRPEALDAPPGLLGAVLETTTGRACERAQTLFCDCLDGALPRLDAELLRAHADGCPDCRAFELALARLAVELPAMRTLAPDPSFVGAVLRATSRAETDRPSARRRSFWRAVVQRPRFAWEAAYVGAMLLWIVLGTPIAMPDVARVAPTGPSTAITSVQAEVSGLGRRAWNSARATWSRSLGRLHADLRARSERAQQPVENLLDHGGELGSAVTALDVRGSGRAMGELTLDAGRVVSRFVSDQENEQE